MEFKKLGRTNVPVLGVGTWEIGGRFEPSSSAEERKKSVEAIRAAVELGMTHIDTAEAYGAGAAEEIVGEAIRGFAREKLFITSKAWRNHLTHDEAIKAAERSCKRMGTSYLDLYLIHWPNTDVPIRETLGAFEELQEQGMVRNIGVSNFSAEQIIEAQHTLKKAEIAAVQNEYSILHQDRAVLELCEKEGIILVAYKPLAKGKLAKPGIAELDGLAVKYGKTPAQVAINWLIEKKPVITIPKATTKSHLADNLGALGWKMSKEDYEILDKVHQ